MATEIQTVPTGEEIGAMQARLGRKFNAVDVFEDDALYAAAIRYVKQYDGSFGFMIEMQAAFRRNGRLTDGQAGGVLNCLAARHKPKAPALEVAKPENPASELVAGNYAIEHPQHGTVVLRLHKPAYGDFAPGELVVKGEDPITGEWGAFAKVAPDGKIVTWRKNPQLVVHRAALPLLVAHPDPAALGYAYANATGKCFHCNKNLKVDKSLYGGLGPDCAKKLGRRHGTRVDGTTVKEAA